MDIVWTAENRENLVMEGSIDLRLKEEDDEADDKNKDDYNNEDTEEEEEETDSEGDYQTKEEEVDYEDYLLNYEVKGVPQLFLGIFRAVFDEDFEKIKKLVSEGDSINIYDQYGNSPLHITIIKNNIQILTFLVSQDDIPINARNDKGDTPLHVAVALGQFESVQILLQKGADVNMTDNRKRTPLHKCKNADIAYLLINNKANVNARNNNLETPLHAAVKHGNPEIVCMLLYYNADANVIALNYNWIMSNPTPFMYALYYNKNEEIKDILYNYIDEYNVSSDILNTVVQCNGNRYVEELIKKGAKVTDEIFCYNIRKTIDLNTFKLIWSHFKADDLEYEIDDCAEYKINLSYLDNNPYDEEYYFGQKIEIIMEHSDSSILEIIAEVTDLSCLLHYHHHQLTHDQFTKLTLVLLNYGFKLDYMLVNKVYEYMGYCEWYKILLFMDFNTCSPYHKDWYFETSITSQVICDIRTDLKTEINHQLIGNRTLDKKHLIDALHYWNDNQLVKHLIHYEEVNGREEEVTKVKDYFNMFPAFPSLLELARDQTRKYIVSKFNMEKASQYYTYVNCLEIAPVYKQILMYEKKLYYPIL